MSAAAQGLLPFLRLGVFSTVALPKNQAAIRSYVHLAMIMVGEVGVEPTMFLM